MPTTLTPAKLKTALAQHAKLRTQYGAAFAAFESSEDPIDSPASKKLADTRDRVGHKLQLAADKLTEAGYTLTNMDSEPVAPPEPEPGPVTITLEEVRAGEVIRIGRKGLTGRIWGPRVMEAAPVAEGEEVDAGPMLALHPSWVKQPVFVALADVTSVEVKRDGRYAPVNLG
jgi:hypothetical protein